MYSAFSLGYVEVSSTSRALKASAGFQQELVVPRVVTAQGREEAHVVRVDQRVGDEENHHRRN